MSRRARLGCALLALGAGCDLEPRGQVLLHIATDAPLPNERGLQGGDAGDSPAALFERLRVDVIPHGERVCEPACEQEFPVSEQSVRAQGGLSLGIVLPARTAGHSVRVRLYPSFATGEAGPDARSTIDALVTLPPVPERGDPLDVTVVLRARDVGIPAQLQAPLLRGPTGEESRLTSEALARPCEARAPEGAVCVPGGVFWMGGPGALASPTALDVGRPRLVRLSPYYLQATEVTRGAYLGASSALSAYPVTLVSRDQARAYCRALGGDLPSEAQFAFAQGGRANRRYVWGADEPTCKDAIWGRGPDGFFTDCLTADDRSGPQPPGSGTRDRLELPGGTLYDLAGNVSEWVRDTWNRQDEPCWDEPFAEDPVCETLGVAGREQGVVYTIRGGGWAFPPAAMSPLSRTGLSEQYLAEHPLVLTGVGFRCAFPG